ncbi:anaerobic sulfatase maturase [Motiliproteus coralliicola]|uniref:Anaerobic sulfatase maturase n=1 Tax=Motiliproteus coralliicola TaxID=2283196 RepID=A0A369WSJ0_9GAMM|nr:anaerobic sulfatase maturase [Motiliproteus coralliicola]RDE24652.1 anaerobic sulfatase maturase [Motiliproteus coralliicola]
MQQIPIQQHRASRPFHMMIKPVGSACNLDCGYCYYQDKDALLQQPGAKVMSPERLQRFTEQYLAAQPDGTPEVNFGWQGGEPTLAGLDFYRNAVKWQQHYNTRHLSISNAIQTNGSLLDDEWCHFFAEHNFLVGLSIDGPSELHDRQRPVKSGGSSFSQVRRAAQLLQQHQVEFNVLCVVTNVSLVDPIAVYNSIKQLGGRYIQFIPLVVPSPSSISVDELYNFDQDAECSVDAQGYGRFLSTIFDHWLEQDLGRVFVQQFDELIGALLGQPSASCIHAPACGRSLVIENNLSVFSCDHLVYPPYQLNGLEQQSLAELVDGDQQQRFERLKIEQLPPNCNSCRFKPLCNGGCPIHQSGEGTARRNYLCRGYQDFFGHALPYCQAIVRCMQQRLPLQHYRNFLDTSA